MIEAVRGWLTAVVAAAMLISVAGTLIPEGTIRKIASLTGGLILMLVLLQPLAKIEIGKLNLNYQDYAEEITRRQEELQGEQDRALAKRIAEQTEAYIAKRAQDMGIDCGAEVAVETGADGTPYPYRVVLTGERSEKLADVITEELGIPKERQSWDEG